MTRIDGDSRKVGQRKSTFPLIVMGVGVWTDQRTRTTTCSTGTTTTRFGTIPCICLCMIAITLLLLYTSISLFVNDFIAIHKATTTTTSTTMEYTSYIEEQLHRNFGHPHDKNKNNNGEGEGEGEGENDNDETVNIQSINKDSSFSTMTTAKTCITEECIQQIASSMTRAFPIRTDKSSWCRSGTSAAALNDDDDDDDDDKGDGNLESGIILIKVTKAASSTSAGVAIRIATRHSCSNIQWRHRLANEVHYVPQKTFLLTTVREPASRAVSTIFFHTLSRQQSGQQFVITDEIVLQQLQTLTHNHYGATSVGQGGFQLRYIYPYGTIAEYSAWIPDRPDQVMNATTITDNVRKTIDAYDFIIVPERMDESLVAMSLLLQIDVSDVLVTSSKVAGTSQYHLLHPNKRTYYCLSTRQSYVTPVVARYLQSHGWRAMNYGDYILYEAAKQSLDRTIHETIGIVPFQIALQRYRILKQLEQTYCAPNVQFPCSNDGKPQLSVAKENCYLYYYDFGCGYPCIDNIIQQYDNGTLRESLDRSTSTSK